MVQSIEMRFNAPLEITCPGRVAPGSSKRYHFIVGDTYRVNAMWLLHLILVTLGCHLAAGVAPTATTLTIAKDPAYTRTNICLGEKHVLVLTAVFAGGSTSGVKIELLPSVTESILILGDIVSITTGSLTFSSSTWQTNPAKDQTPESIAANADQKYYNRLVYDLGTVTNNAADEAGSTLTIKYEVILHNMRTKTNTDSIWTSSGMEYDSGSRIWIAQLQLTLLSTCDMTVSNTASASVSTGDLPLFTVTTRTITLLLAGPMNTIVVSVMAMEGEVYPQKLRLTSVGSNLEYTYTTTTPTNIFSERFHQCTPYDILELSIPETVNKEAYESDTDLTDSQMVFEVDLQVMNSSQVGESVKVAYGININDAEIFASVLTESVITSTPPAFSASDYVLTAPASIPIGFPGHFNLDVTIPAASNLDYVMDVVTTDFLSILAVTPTSYGDNMPCEIPSMYQELTLVDNNGVNNNAQFKFNISNFGLKTGNTLTLKITAMMTTDAVEGSTYSLTANINNAGIASATTDVAAALPYDSDVNFIFTFNIDCATLPDISSGSNFTGSIVIQTERNKVTGDFHFEFPIPGDLTNSNLVVYKAWVDSKGKNNLCQQLGDIDLTLSKWDEASAEYDRAQGVIPMMCNTEVGTATADDMLTIKMLLGVKNSEAINAADNTAEQLCIGANYSSNQIWVSCINFTTLGAVDLGAAKEISALAFDAEPPEDFMFQWSVDKITFYNNPHMFKPVTNPLSHVREFERPILAQYIRVVSTRGLCPVTYTATQTTVTSVRIYSTDPQKAEHLKKILQLALDKDLTTCARLPRRGDSNTPPFLWMEMDNTLLGMLTNVSTGFDLTVVGNGLKVTNQFTWMMYPSDTGLSSFNGDRQRCDWTAPSTTELSFNCACEDVDQCAKNTLVFLFNATAADVPDPYELCEIYITGTM